jgi:hypothetical protein
VGRHGEALLCSGRRREDDDGATCLGGKAQGFATQQSSGKVAQGDDRVELQNRKRTLLAGKPMGLK